MKKFGVFILIILSLYVFNVNAQEEKIVIFHLNDIHGRIDKFPRVKFLIDSITKSENAYALFLNAGDLFSGNPYVDKHKDQGFPIIDLLNEMNLNASTLGNHEFDYGLNTLNKRIKQAQFQFLACNVSSGDSVISNIKDYQLFKTAKGNRLVVLGITQVSNNGIPDTHPAKVKGLNFVQGSEQVKKYKKLDKKSEIFILLSHMGFELDTALGNTFKGPDLLIGGHSHKFLETPIQTKFFPVVQVGSYAKSLGVYTFTINKKKIINRSYKIFNINSNANEDQTLKAKIEAFKNNPEFNEVIGEAKQDILGVDALGSLMAQAYVSSCGADLAVQNSGGVRISKFLKGDIILKQIYELDPFDNPIVIVEITPEQIIELIKTSIQIQGDYDLLPAGFSYKIIRENGILKDVKPDFSQTKPNKSGKYRMALNSYVYLTYIKEKMNMNETGISSNQALITFIKKNKEISPLNGINKKINGKY